MSIHTLSTKKIRTWIRPFVWGFGITQTGVPAFAQEQSTIEKVDSISALLPH